MCFAYIHSNLTYLTVDCHKTCQNNQNRGYRKRLEKLTQPTIRNNNSNILLTLGHSQRNTNDKRSWIHSKNWRITHKNILYTLQTQGCTLPQHFESNRKGIIFTQLDLKTTYQKRSKTRILKKYLTKNYKISPNL